MTTVSEACRDMRCGHCTTAGCDHQCHREVRVIARAVDYGYMTGQIRAVKTRDLLAHLRSGVDGLDLDAAYRVTKLVIDLGWRPLVGEAGPE